MKVSCTISMEYEDWEMLREWSSSRGRSVSNVVREAIGGLVLEPPSELVDNQPSTSHTDQAVEIEDSK